MTEENNVSEQGKTRYVKVYEQAMKHTMSWICFIRYVSSSFCCFMSITQFIIGWFVDESVAYVRRCELDEGLEGGDVVVWVCVRWCIWMVPMAVYVPDGEWRWIVWVCCETLV